MKLCPLYCSHCSWKTWNYFLRRNVDSGLTLFDITLILLLFADDMVIFGSSQEDLQNSLNLLYEYCQKWGLVVNTDKTKVLILEKEAELIIEFTFYIIKHS